MAPFPCSVIAGNTGVLGTMDLSIESQRDDHAGTIQVSYAVIPDPNNAGSVILELTEKIFYTTNGNPDPNNPDQTTQFNYSLTAAGGMSLQSLSITYPATEKSSEQALVYTVQQ